MPQTKPGSDNASQLLKSLMVLAKAVDQVLQRQNLDSSAQRPLAGSQMNILLLLGHRGSDTPTRIARFLGVSKPAVTQLIDAMIACDWVRRRPGSEDRRVVRLELTSKGRRKFATIKRRQLQVVRVALESAPSRDKVRWIQTVQDVARSLVQAGKAYEEFCLQCGAHADGTCVLEGGSACCVVRETSGNPRGKSHVQLMTVR